MASPVVNLASGLASTIVTFGAIVLAAGVVALVAARQCGGRSALRRQVIFAVVGFAGLIVAVVVALGRLRGMR